MSKGQIVLDDGVFYIELNDNHKASIAPGFLQRRCPHGLTTPGGFECVGSFDRSLDDTWQASVNAPYDPETDSDSKTVAEGVSRMDAIAALWAARKSALASQK